MATKIKKQDRDEISQQLSDLHSYGINIDDREIYINGDYHSGDEISYMTSIDFIKNLHFLEKLDKTKITVHMHIDGGSWEYGLAMMDAIHACESPITVFTHSQASSMSGVILQAADHRIMMPNSYFMMHYGSIGIESTGSQIASSAIKFNDRSNDQMLSIFANRAISGKFAGEKKYDLKKMIKFFDKKIKDQGDWYLSAEEAVYYGLADEIYKKGDLNV